MPYLKQRNFVNLPIVKNHKNLNIRLCQVTVNGQQ